MQSDLGLPCLSWQLVFEILDYLLQFIMSLKKTVAHVSGKQGLWPSLVIVCKMYFG